MGKNFSRKAIMQGLSDKLAEFESYMALVDVNILDDIIVEQAQKVQFLLYAGEFDPEVAKEYFIENALLQVLNSYRELVFDKKVSSVAY